MHPHEMRLKEFVRCSTVQVDHSTRHKWRKVIYPGGCMYTDKTGRHAKRKVHSVLINLAIEQGLKVPPEVLQDHFKQGVL